MAVSIIGATVPVPFWAILLAVMAFLGVGFFAFIVLMFSMQIPDVFSQIKCQMKRQASVSMHFVNRRRKMYAPQREGKSKQKNTLNLPKALGAKFDPSGEGMEEMWGKSIDYHFFSKASFPISAVDAKAIGDFYNFLGQKGIQKDNKALIDFLLVENLDTLEVYTEPLKQWVLKNLPIPIATNKEYLLDKGLIDADMRKIHGSIAAIDANITKYQNADELTEEQDAELNTLVNAREQYGIELSKVEARLTEYNDLQKAKHDLRITLDSMEDLQKKKVELLEKIDIMTGYLDPVTRETAYTLRRLKSDLQKLVISDGLFVFQKVQGVIFAASSLNSAGMNEAVSIANADAYMQNSEDQSGWTMPMVMMAIVGIITLLAGIGIAYKIAFG